MRKMSQKGWKEKKRKKFLKAILISLKHLINDTVYDFINHFMGMISKIHKYSCKKLSAHSKI